ncbi:MAG: hypothetical protein HQL87_01590 [Magnetococcales bacterium]|nr:hypothetical protein [Magnetococcales bacterium]
MSCRDFVQKTGSRCAEFAKLAACQCENVTTSEHSPGSVANGESLIRHIFSSQQYHAETGTLRANAFDDIWGDGLSVTRKDHVSCGDFASLTSDLLEVKKKRNPLTKLEGVLLISVNAIRGMCWDADLSRMLCVYDTGTESNPAHADVCTPRIPLTKDEKAELRDFLTEISGTLCVDWRPLFR